MDPIVAELNQAINASRPVMATSILKTFGKVTAFLFSLAWLLCMPVEMILHRRMGKRYCNTFFVMFALVALGFVASASMSVATFARGLLVGTASTANAETVQAQRRARATPDDDARQLLDMPERQQLGNLLSANSAARASLVAFTALHALALLAFVAHYVANRRRFGTQDQGHSCDFGIPWLIYPPSASKLVPAKPRLRLLPSQGNKEPNPLARTSAHPLSIVRELREAAVHHLSCLRRGEAPHGPFNWLYLMYGEPLLLATIGAVMFVLSASLAAFGLYLGLVAFGLWFKGMVHQAEWRERAYDDMDNKLEADALRNWRAGSHANAIARQFTVPIASAILAKRVVRGNEPIMLGPEFDYMLSPEAKAQQQFYRDAG